MDKICSTIDASGEIKLKRWKKVTCFTSLLQHILYICAQYTSLMERSEFLLNIYFTFLSFGKEVRLDIFLDMKSSSLSNHIKLEGKLQIDKTRWRN